jgi:CheY-like chemotaxis protein
MVEDVEDDVILMLRAFQKASMTNPIQIVRTGEEALAYLSGEGKYASREEYPLPDLVLLDLTLPGMDGFEVLTWIRQEDSLRSLPVVVLTSSSRIRDVNRAYSLGANSFFVKELDFGQAVDLSLLLRQYWMEKARKPEVSRPVPRTREDWEPL